MRYIFSRHELIAQCHRLPQGYLTEAQSPDLCRINSCSPEAFPREEGATRETSRHSQKVQNFKRLMFTSLRFSDGYRQLSSCRDGSGIANRTPLSVITESSLESTEIKPFPICIPGALSFKHTVPCSGTNVLQPNRKAQIISKYFTVSILP